MRPTADAVKLNASRTLWPRSRVHGSDRAVPLLFHFQCEITLIFEFESRRTAPSVIKPRLDPSLIPRSSHSTSYSASLLPKSLYIELDPISTRHYDDKMDLACRDGGTPEAADVSDGLPHMLHPRSS